ncbi:LuxR C-terminal-related transcriptional regulator [Streptomyces sp. NBC_00825]|nr:LuxR C-terminal-related transcriptional regulator [Streptomyces sp. NBC_00826]WTH89039.1 LuxR C-terminal-related transcriptional regulator [Streptomyces sp. NBC_00825]WTH97769.1 LuxR C-terminal-related transcriptional regulator [Streptomyces sp. NBC_00822]
MHPFPPPELRLSARQREIAGYRAAGLAVAEIAKELRISRASVHGHLRNARSTAGVHVDRALVYCVLASKTVHLTRRTSLAVPDALTQLVWRGLRYNVPDSELISTIAQISLHPRDDVARALDELRTSTKISDCGLVGLAFTTGLLCADEGVEPTTAPTGLRPTKGGYSQDLPRLKDIPSTPIPPEQNHKPAQGKPQETPGRRPQTSPADPLGLLPKGMPERQNPSPVLRWLQSRPLVVGADVQAVRVSPEVCADYLQHRYEQGIPRRQWGPVLGDTDARCALFLLPPRSLPAQWSCADGRVLRNGLVLDLRPPLLPTSRMYWAFTPGAWWSLKQLTRLADRASSMGQALPDPSVTAIT